MAVLKTFFLSIVLQGLIPNRSYEYCKYEKELCWGKTNAHIMCNPEQIQPETEYQDHYLMTDKLRDLFTYWHNYHRNLAACGGVQGKDVLLPPAKQMRELVWDYELEYLARKHAGRVRQQHDLCRNSFRIPDSGQNLSHKRTKYKPLPTPMERSRSSTTMWFSESKDVTLEWLKSFPSKSEMPPAAPGTKQMEIGHFTVMVNDNVGRLGCAVSWGKSFPEAVLFNHTYVTCNYDYTNIITYTTYQEGKPASNCGFFGSYGLSSNFTCLCAKTFIKKNTTAWF